MNSRVLLGAAVAVTCAAVVVLSVGLLVSSSLAVTTTPSTVDLDEWTSNIQSPDSVPASHSSTVAGVTQADVSLSTVPATTRQSKQLFIILANARSATTFLNSLLNEDSQVHSFGEAVPPELRVFPFGKVSKILRAGDIPQYLRLISSVFRRETPHHTVGFKLLYQHCPLPWATPVLAWFAQHNVSVIQVQRHPVPMVVSWFEAIASRVWQLTSNHTDNRTTVPLRISAAKLASQLSSWVTMLHEWTVAMEATAGLRVIVVTYHDLVTNTTATLHEIFRFLHVSPPHELSLDHVEHKIHSSGLHHRIADWDTVRVDLKTHWPKLWHYFAEAEAFGDRLVYY